jgi:hypothetical protein
MSYGVVLVFEGVTADQYWAVNDKLGINPDGTGDWPDGLITHTGGGTEDGGWVVSEVWASKDHQEQFMASRLGAALGEVQVPPPAQVLETEVVNHRSPGA